MFNVNTKKSIIEHPPIDKKISKDMATYVLNLCKPCMNGFLRVIRTF